MERPQQRRGVQGQQKGRQGNQLLGGEQHQGQNHDDHLPGVLRVHQGTRTLRLPHGIHPLTTEIQLGVPVDADLPPALPHRAGMFPVNNRNLNQSHVRLLAEHLHGVQLPEGVRPARTMVQMPPPGGPLHEERRGVVEERKPHLPSNNPLPRTFPTGGLVRATLAKERLLNSTPAKLLLTNATLSKISKVLLAQLKNPTI